MGLKLDQPPIDSHLSFGVERKSAKVKHNWLKIEGFFRACFRFRFAKRGHPGSFTSNELTQIIGDRIGSLFIHGGD